MSLAEVKLIEVKWTKLNWDDMTWNEEVLYKITILGSRNENRFTSHFNQKLFDQNYNLNLMLLVACIIRYFI